MIWINFLHFYQPVNTDAHIIKEATEKSYLRVVRALEENPHIKFTFNVNGCLFYRLEELGYSNLLRRLVVLVKKGQLELTGNAAYHPLLPLIDIREVERQILETESLLQKYFGQNYKPKGFFLSEMAYSQKVAELIKKMGYEWIILDEISKSGKLEEVDQSKEYVDKYSGLKVIFRSRNLSNSFVPRTIQKLHEEKREGCFVTATDGELYGLRHIDHTGEFEKILKIKDLKTLTISECQKTKKESEIVSPVSSNWESTESEMCNKRPFFLWHNKKNVVQANLWRLANLTYKAVESRTDDDNYVWARWHLVRGLASCTFWWASGKDFSHNFGPLAWNPDEIERGTNEFIRAVRALENENTRSLKMKAEKLYIQIKKQIWEQHWAYYWKKNNDK